MFRQPGAKWGPRRKVSNRVKRRQFVAGGASLLGLAAAGCVSSPRPLPDRQGYGVNVGVPSYYRSLYGPMEQERFPVPPVDLTRVPERFWRREVDYYAGYPVGALVVDTNEFYLYLVQPNNTAIRYGVGLGRAGFSWSGNGYIEWKQAWPTWTPPASMIDRQPELARWGAENGGMPPGLDNPLGARALYIFQNGKDTLYRIHGSPEYWSIGQAVSSGCVRLMNQDIVDLYDRVPVGSKLIVI